MNFSITLFLVCILQSFFVQAFGVDLPSSNTFDFLYTPKNFISNSASSRDGRTVFVFLSSECPCSDSYIEELNRVFGLYKSRVVFYGVHSNHKEDLKKTADYFHSKNLMFPVIKDNQNQKFLNLFKAFKTPHVYILKNNEVIYHGAVGSTRHAEKEMTAYLDRALSQNAHPNPKLTKTMGCLIERL